MRSIPVEDQTSRRLLFVAVAFVSLVCAAILCVGIWREWSEREATFRAAEVDMSNMARSLAQHAEDSVGLADSIIIGLVERLERRGTGASNAPSAGVLAVLRSSTDRIRGLFIYDQEGSWLATSEPVNLLGMNNADRDYFIFHRTHDTNTVFIGAPVLSRSGNQWIVTVSRRFNHADGTFAGVVLATIDVAYFSQFYARFDAGENGSISLLTTSGILLARSPDDGSYVGRDMSRTGLFTGRMPLAGSGSHEFRSPLDGRQRVSFYHASSRYPLVVLATEAKETVLAGWWRGAMIRMGIIATLTVLIAVIGWHLIQQLRLRQSMAAALASREADFRLLAEGFSDMVMRIGFDGTLLYVSPSSFRVLGWNAEQLIGGQALAGINPADRPRAEHAIAGLRAGEITEAKILYRNRHREKTEIWIETTLRVTRSSSTGRIDGVVAISRDMTDHKDIEDRLAELAATDALTCVGNRRSFDERLEVEWAQAMREDLGLSLLLIDLDNFKKYNDRYGHQAGDACLKAVAACVAEQASRPTDFVARYGGEELVVILADTDRSGSASVGNRILEALGDLGLPHAENLPSQIVSVSIGAATAYPARDPYAEAANLIAAADAALYGAKRSGRGKMISAGEVIPLRRSTA